MERQFVIQYQLSLNEGIDITTSFATIPHADDCKEKIIDEYNSYFKNDPNYKILYVRSVSTDGIDWELMERMRAVRSICELGHKVRAEVKIRNRQPLSKAYILFSDSGVRDYMIYCDRSAEYNDILSDELNVDNIEFVDSNNGFVDILLKPNFKVLGPKGFGKKAQALKPVLADTPPAKRKEIFDLLQKGETINLCEIPLTLQDVEVEFVPRPGFSSATSKLGAIVMDTNLTEELLERGFIAEFRSAIQNIRKSTKLELSDRISLEVFCSEEKARIISKFENKLKKDLLTVNIAFPNESKLDKTLAHNFSIDENVYQVNLYKEYDHTT